MSTENRYNIGEYVQSMIENYQKALGIKPNRQCSISCNINTCDINKGINSEELDELLKENKINNKSKYIYIIKSESENFNEIKQLMLEAKKNNRDIKYSQVNENKEAGLSKTLYVGSVQEKLFSRLKCHCGFGSPTTYALHLNTWFNGKIEIEIFEFKSEIEPTILQIIEDGYAYKLNPMFGKRGGK